MHLDRINLHRLYKSFVTKDTRRSHGIPHRRILWNATHAVIDSLDDDAFIDEKERKEIFLRRNCHVPFDFIFFEGIYGKKDEDCKEILHKYLAKPIGYEGCSKIEKKYKCDREPIDKNNWVKKNNIPCLNCNLEK